MQGYEQELEISVWTASAQGSRNEDLEISRDNVQELVFILRLKIFKNTAWIILLVVSFVFWSRACYYRGVW